MPQIILKERTANLASYTFFTRDAPFSQLYQPPRAPRAHKTLITTYFCTVNFAKFLRTTFYRTPPEAELFLDVLQNKCS